MTNDHHDPEAAPELTDEFWGERTEWVAQGPPVARRRGAGAAIAAWWNAVLGGGVAAGRTHGGSVRRPPAAGHRDEWSDDEWSDADADATVDEWSDADADVTVDEWSDDDAAVTGEDDEWAWSVEPEPTPSTRPGVDPLIARLGGLAVIVTLAAPLIVGFTASDNDSASDGSTPAVIESAAPTIVPPTSAPAAVADSAPATAPAPAAVSAASTAVSDASTDADDRADTDGTNDKADTADTAAGGGDAVVSADTAPLQLAAQPTTIADVSATDAAAPSCGNRYELAAGDYWIRIADAADVSLTDLLAVNDASVDTVLVPGRSVCLPVGASTPSPPTTAAPATTTPPSRQSAAGTTPAAPATAPPATTAPTTTAPARPAAVPESQATAIIRAVWPDELEERALQIAWRESNHQSNVNNFCCYGLFQIYFDVHRSWLSTIGVDSAKDLFDPQLNTQAAYMLYQRAGGWGPWGG